MRDKFCNQPIEHGEEPTEVCKFLTKSRTKLLINMVFYSIFFNLLPHVFLTTWNLIRYYLDIIKHESCINSLNLRSNFADLNI